MKLAQPFNPFKILFYEWATRWKFAFSVESALVIFSRKFKKPPDPLLTLYGQLIPRNDVIWFWGLLFDSQLKWDPHVEKIISQAIKRSNLISILARAKNDRLSKLL